MLILGIESSCDETAAAVVEDGRRVLSSVVASQHDIHREYAGVVPELASRAHVECILPVVREALGEAGVGLGWIDAVAVGHRPGLIGSLLIGVTAAKSLAWSLGRPLVGVDHVHAHLYSGVLDVETKTEFPALGLVVSGGHTSLYHLDSWTCVRRLGATIDDAMGEAFDKVATILGIAYPGGPGVDRLACVAGADDRAFDFPVSRLGAESLDFSFSGLKTAVLYAVRGVPGERHATPRAPLNERQRADVAASFQRAAVKAVMLKLARAMDAGDYRAIVAGGGVTANSRLRRELGAFAQERGAGGVGLALPAARYCVDNAAMIAGLAYPLHTAGQVSELSLRAIPTTAC